MEGPEGGGCVVSLLYTFPPDALGVVSTGVSGLVRSERGGSLFVHALTSPKPGFLSNWPAYLGLPASINQSVNPAAACVRCAARDPTPEAPPAPESRRRFPTDRQTDIQNRPACPAYPTLCVCSTPPHPFPCSSTPRDSDGIEQLFVSCALLSDLLGRGSDRQARRRRFLSSQKALLPASSSYVRHSDGLWQ